MESSNNNKKFAMNILAKQLRDCQNNDDLSASIGLVNDENLF